MAQLLSSQGSLVASPCFPPALPTALQGGMFPQFPLRTPMQPFFNPQVPGAPARPTHRQGSASLASFTPSALNPAFPMTPGAGHFPRPSLMMGQSFPGPAPGGPPFPGRNRRQPSIGGPPKAVLGGPARKVSPMPPVPAVTAPPVKTKKVIVKLPNESPKDDDGKPLEKPSWARIPLETPFVYKEVQVSQAELTTAESYPSDSWRLEIPSTIDVFLPGKRAWQEIKKREIDEKLERLGVERSNSVHIHAPHARAASISSPADPALLFFKLNKLQQSQTQSSLNPSTVNSSSASPQPPFGLSPSPHHQAPRFLTNRHGYSMSLAQPPTFHSPSAPSSTFGGPTNNPFGPNAFLGSDQRSLPENRAPDSESEGEPIHAPQGRVPLSMSSLTAPRSLSRPESRDSRPDFIRGFGLDVTEEEDETEEEAETHDSFAPNDGDNEDSEEEGDGLRTARHSRHVSRLSGALSLRSVGGVVGDNINGHAHERTDIAAGDESQDMDLDQEVTAEWTGSEDQEQFRGGQEMSEDESIGEYSNPSDEERARQQRVERRMQRRLDDQPRRVPNFPRPPDNTVIVPRPHEDDMISNPSEEEALRRGEYLGVDPNNYYSASPSGGSRPLPALPHSRATSGNFTTHDPAQAHSRLPSDNFNFPQPQLAQQPLPRRDSLNPHAKPFVFGAPVEQFVFGASSVASPNPWSTHRPQTPPKAPLITHSRLPSIGTALNPAAAEFRPTGFNPAAAEFKPSGFTFRPPPGVPQMAFPEPEPAQPTAESTPYKTQGREKRQRRSLSDASNEEGDSMSSFRFPPNVDSPQSIRRAAPASTAHSSLNPSAEPFTFAGFGGARDTVPLLPSLMPLSPGAEEAPNNDESVGTAKPDVKPDAAADEGEREFVLPVGRPKRAPIPLDFSHSSSPSTQLDFRSSNTVPAGLFKAMVSGGDERTRRTVRSRLSSREIFDHSQRPSLDDLNVPPISVSRKISRARLVTDPGNRPVSPADDIFSSSVRRPPCCARTETVLFAAGRDAGADKFVGVGRGYEQRLEALLDEKLDEIRRDVVRTKGSLSPSAEAMIAEVVQLFRSQLQNSVARSSEDSRVDARGELDFELIKDVVQQGHAEARAVLKRELADIGMRMAQGQMPIDSAESMAPLLRELNSRTVEAVVEAIQELSVRLEAISAAAPARERDSTVDALMSALAPVLDSLHPEAVDYDYLTEKLAHAVKPHISQLIDLTSDKRETAGLIVEQLTPLLPSSKANKVDTDAIALQLCAEVRRAIAPIDAFEIKEQVADLVVERLDSRLAVRDRAFNPETMAGKVADGVANLFGAYESSNDALTDLASTHKQVVDLMGDLPPRLVAAIEALNAAQTQVPRTNGVVAHDSEPSEHILRIKSVVEDVAGEQKTLSAHSRELLSLHKEALEQLTVLPESLAAATNILHGAHAEFALTRDANKREMDELRRNNTEYQVQMAKARGAHGQVRVEKEVIAEKLSIVEADRDRLRLQLKELQASTSSNAVDLSAVEARNKELEDALAKALARLQASDVTHQTSQERVLELEKVNRELTSEKQTLKAKVDSLDLQATFATRDKDSAVQALSALQKQYDHLTSQQSHWDDLRHASAQIEMLTNLIGQADNEELKELRHVRDRSKVLEGEHAALIKRFKDQEAKVANSEKAAMAARQSLSQAQQRSAEWEKRAKEYEAQLEMTQTKLDQAEQTQSQLDADYSLVKLQLEEREADERLAKDRDNKLRDQIVALEAKVNQLQVELDRSRAKTPTKPAPPPSAAPSPYRNITNGGVHRPDSRASTVYPSRPSSPSARSVTPPGPSVWDSMHAPRGPPNGSAASMHAPTTHTPTPSSRYSSLGNKRRPPSQAYSRYPQARAAPPSPTPSTVSLAPTQGPDAGMEICIGFIDKKFGNFVQIKHRRPGHNTAEEAEVAGKKTTCTSNVANRCSINRRDERGFRDASVFSRPK
ncbi:hypothetical protein MVEN_01937200 [Mycena venus]|uniref:Uncharacterized protein n=1 Tax=Mycena venus TaxID=2733690 RepID=A0A8H6XGR5_9AGAR|nr:hypothetical protein MVEN_01937200 [Mycena venus]